MNIQSIELGKILYSDTNSSIDFFLSLCIALLSKSKIVCSNFGVTTKFWPDQSASTTYSNLICKQTLELYPCFLACFINQKTDCY